MCCLRCSAFSCSCRFCPRFNGSWTHTAPDLTRQIANANTLFNVIMAVVFLPFIGLFAKLIVKLVPEKAEEKKFGSMYLDDHVLGTPSLALGQATREALRASDIVREMLTDMIKGLQER